MGCEDGHEAVEVLDVQAHSSGQFIVSEARVFTTNR